MPKMATNFTRDPNFPFVYFRHGAFITQGDAPLLDTVYSSFLLLVSFTGMVTNGLNIRAFLLIGKQDGVTVSMLSLSLSDFIQCKVSFISMAAILVVKMEIVYAIYLFIDPLILAGFGFCLGYTFYAITSLATTFLAVARCMCVARPLQFSKMFTRSRSIAIHICFAVICIGGYFPVLFESSAGPTFNFVTNRTHVSLWFSDFREEVKDIVFLIFDTFLTFASQFVLVVCVVIMRRCLTQAGQFRQSTKAATQTTAPTSNDDGKNNDNNTEQYKLSGKELQVVQQVVLISVIYLVCALPKIFSSFYSLIEPEFDVGKKLKKFYFVAVNIRKAFEFANSSSTFFIYYKYNSKFRELYSKTS